MYTYVVKIGPENENQFSNLIHFDTVIEPLTDDLTMVRVDADIDRLLDLATGIITYWCFDLDRGICCDYAGGEYTAVGYETYNNYYSLSYHKGEMPSFNGDSFGTAIEMLAKMIQLNPDPNTWYHTNQIEGDEE